MASSDGSGTVPLDQGMFSDMESMQWALGGFAVDIGGSLAKVVYYAASRRRSLDAETAQHVRPGSDAQDDSATSVDDAHEQGRLHLAVFETKHISAFMDFILETVRPNFLERPMAATGGGAHRFAQLFESKLGCRWGNQRGKESKESISEQTTRKNKHQTNKRTGEPMYTRRTPNYNNNSNTTATSTQGS
eukprot:m.127231 g.127231  ORF g.127231 m.127231 type:complete len:190 (-) comp16699_c0_seq3:2397-2966(-)